MKPKPVQPSVCRLSPSGAHHWRIRPYPTKGGRSVRHIGLCRYCLGTRRFVGVYNG